jgi:hypothetical protein
MGQRKAAPVDFEAKAKQASKLGEIRGALLAAGYDSTAKQAAALGVCRSTAWGLFNCDKRAGPSAVIIKRILSSPNLPAAAQRKVEEYIVEKIKGRYGHRENQKRWFRDQFRTFSLSADENSSADEKLLS